MKKSTKQIFQEAADILDLPLIFANPALANLNLDALDPSQFSEDGLALVVSPIYATGLPIHSTLGVQYLYEVAVVALLPLDFDDDEAETLLNKCEAKLLTLRRELQLDVTTANSFVDRFDSHLCGVFVNAYFADGGLCQYDKKIYFDENEFQGLGTEVVPIKLRTVPAAKVQVDATTTLPEALQALTQEVEGVQSSIPTKVSELPNDAEYITLNDLPPAPTPTADRVLVDITTSEPVSYIDITHDKNGSPLNITAPFKITRIGGGGMSTSWLWSINFNGNITQSDWVNSQRGGVNPLYAGAMIYSGGNAIMNAEVTCFIDGGVIKWTAQQRNASYVKDAGGNITGISVIGNNAWVQAGSSKPSVTFTSVTQLTMQDVVRAVQIPTGTRIVVELI